MKLLLILGALILASQTTALAAAPACGDLSGDFTTGEIDVKGRTLVWVLQQDACNSLGVGSYNMQRGVKSDVVAPIITYVSAGTTQLCQIKNCTIFTGTGTGIVFARDGSLKVSATLSCRYDQVQWSLDAGGHLIQAYRMKDSSKACKTQPPIVQRKLYRLH